MIYLPSHSKKLYQLTCCHWWCLNLPFPLKDAAENGQGHSFPEATAVRHSPFPPSFSFFFSLSISLYPLFQLAGFCSLDVMVKDLFSGIRRGNKTEPVGVHHCEYSLHFGIPRPTFPSFICPAPSLLLPIPHLHIPSHTCRFIHRQREIRGQD